MSRDRLLPEGLLEIMQCPNCAGTLREDVEASELQCLNCGLRYPVDEHGIPVMMLDQARPAAD